jgi:hypothetical protein
MASIAQSGERQTEDLKVTCSIHVRSNLLLILLFFVHRIVRPSSAPLASSSSIFSLHLQSAVRRLRAISIIIAVIMGNALEGAMAMNKAKNFVSDAGIPIPGQGGDGDKKGDAKIDAKVAKRQAEIEERKKMRMTKEEELEQRKKDRAVRKAELEKARGFR